MLLLKINTDWVKLSHRDVIRVNRKLVAKPHTLAVLILLFASVLSYQEPEKGKALENQQQPTSSQQQEVNFSIPNPNPIPLLTTDYQLPTTEISAQSALVLDYHSHTILFQKDAHDRLPPASLTKIMTAIIALENYALDQTITIDKSFIDGSQMGLVNGEPITVENLVWGLLLNSGNDAAYVLASQAIKLSSHQETIDNVLAQFIARMNKKAQELNMKNTHFTNPIGLDNPEHYSTVYDLALLSKYALNNPKFAEMVSTSEKTVSSTTLDHWHHLKNTNALLGNMEGVTGVKTGWTESAGECFILSIIRNNHEVILVILGSQARIEDARTLVNWIFSNYLW